MTNVFPTEPARDYCLALMEELDSSSLGTALMQGGHGRMFGILVCADGTVCLMSSFGICLCILSILNPIIIGSIPFINDDFGAVLFFLFIALGVFLITSANIRMNGYDRLLELNEAGRMSEGTCLHR